MDFIVPDGMNVIRPDRYVRDIGDPQTAEILRDTESSGNVLRVAVDGAHLDWQHGTFSLRVKQDSIVAPTLTDDTFHSKVFRCFAMRFGYRTDSSVILLSTFEDASEWFNRFTSSIADMLPCPIADTIGES